MTSSWQVEHLFATPMVETDLSCSIDLRTLGAAIEVSDAVSMPAEPLVRQLRALVDRMTTHAGTQGAPGTQIDWWIGMEAIRVAPGRSLAMPPHWDAFWTAVAVLEGDGVMTMADPRLPATMMEAPALRLRLDKDELYAPDVRHPLLPRRVLIFPGWLRCTCEAGAAPISLVRVSFVAPLPGARA